MHHKSKSEFFCSFVLHEAIIAHRVARGHGRLVPAISHASHLFIEEAHLYKVNEK